MKTPAHVIGTGALTLTLAAVLASCGSSGGGNAGGPSNQQFGSGGSVKGGGQGGPGGPGSPGASGKVAAVSGRTAQVQSADSQTAVTWTARTAFAQEVTATADDLKVGDCVVATPAPSSSSSASAGSSASSTGTTTVAASTVRILSTSGDCARGPGGRPGRTFASGPSGAPTALPSGAPSGLPSGAPGRLVTVGAVGKVSAVHAGGFTVASMQPGGTKQHVRVTTSLTTSYTRTTSATASDVKVGLCLTAQGSTDSTGAVAAQRVDLSPPVDGGCGLSTFRSGPGLSTGAA